MALVTTGGDNARVEGFRAGPAGAVLAALVAFGTLATPAPSYADETVVVQGTAFPDPARANLSLVGCADLYQRAGEPLQPMVGRGPGAAPAGERSLGFDLAGGDAVGALFAVDSVLTTTTASLAVNAVGRATGVAYAGYQEPADAGSSLLWLGRSDLVTPGGAWQSVEATTRAYTWTKYDMTTRSPVLASGVVATVADFAAAHGGDGPGVFTIGFGCDGTAFSMDQLQIGTVADGVRTYDVEGLRTQVTIAASHPKSLEPGEPVTLTGQLRTETGDPIPHATMILEQRSADSTTWTRVLVARVGHDGVRAEVTPGARCSTAGGSSTGRWPRAPPRCRWSSTCCRRCPTARPPPATRPAIPPSTPPSTPPLIRPPSRPPRSTRPRTSRAPRTPRRPRPPTPPPPVRPRPRRPPSPDRLRGPVGPPASPSGPAAPGPLTSGAAPREDFKRPPLLG